MNGTISLMQPAALHLLQVLGCLAVLSMHLAVVEACTLQARY